MNARAEIKTGDRPIYDFILSPIAKRKGRLRLSDKGSLLRLLVGILFVGTISLPGCSEQDRHRENLLRKDPILRNIREGQLPSLVVIAYKQKFNLECPVGEPMSSLLDFFDWSRSEASIGRRHTDYMVCLDLAQERQGALLEAHRILNLAPNLPEDYDRSSVIYAASYLSEASTGSIADQAIGSTRLVELQEPPFPSNSLNAKGKRLVMLTEPAQVTKPGY